MEKSVAAVPLGGTAICVGKSLGQETATLQPRPIPSHPSGMCNQFRPSAERVQREFPESSPPCLRRGHWRQKLPRGVPFMERRHLAGPWVAVRDQKNPGAGGTPALHKERVSREQPALPAARSLAPETPTRRAFYGALASCRPSVQRYNARWLWNTAGTRGSICRTSKPKTYLSLLLSALLMPCPARCSNDGNSKCANCSKRLSSSDWRRRQPSSDASS